MKKRIKRISQLSVVALFLLVPGRAQNNTAPPAGTGAPPPSNPLKVALLKWYGANTTTSFAVGTNPRGVCFDGKNIWVANYGSNTVTKLAANDGTVLGTFNVGAAPANVAFDGANIWATNFGSNNVTKLRASDGAVLGTFAVGVEPFGIAFDGANMWIGDAIGSTAVVTKLRASDGKTLGNFPINSYGFAVMFDGTYIWASGNLGNVTRLKLDGTNAGVFSLGAAGDPFGLAFDGQNVWVADQQAQGTLVKLRARDGALLASINVGAGPYGVAFDGTYIWVTGGTYFGPDRTAERKGAGQFQHSRQLNGHCLRRGRPMDRRLRRECRPQDVSWPVASRKRKECTVKNLPRFKHLLQVAVSACLLSASQLSAQVSIWTWHGSNGDDSWRTGQNAAETTLTPTGTTSVNKSTFGKICYYPVDGQVYAQPLVLWDSANSRNLVYVVTQNDSIYMFNGTNQTQGGQCAAPLASALADGTGTVPSLLPTGEAAVPCGNIGAMNINCGTIKPSVGILGTPVIDESTNHIYLVTYSCDNSCSTGTGTTYRHRVHALFTGLSAGAALTEDTNYTGGMTLGKNGVVVSSGSFSPAFTSFHHIQRPGLLLLPVTDSTTPKLYIGFSMMDGDTSFPSGFLFMYYGDNLVMTGTPVVYATEPTTTPVHYGGGIWMDGAGLAAGLDSSTGSNNLYITTADGDFDPLTTMTQCTDCGDSFVKLTSTLTQSDSFTPCNQVSRWTAPGGGTNPDDDFGSGGVMLIPDGLLSSWPYLAVTADKGIHLSGVNGSIWALLRHAPGEYGGTNCSDNVTESLLGTGVYHNTPAFWKTGSGAGYLYYSSIGGKISQYPVQSTTCTSGTAPICNAIHTSIDPASQPKTSQAALLPRFRRTELREESCGRSTG